MAELSGTQAFVAIRRTRRAFRFRPWGNARLMIGGAIVLLFLAAAIFAPLIAPHRPLDQDLMNALAPPFWLSGGSMEFPLGTDDLGRDVLTRLLFGARITLTIALVSASCACIIGSALGLLAGFFGGAVDQIVSRMIDTWVAFPPVLLAIVLTAMLGAGITSVIIAIVVVDWTRFARIIRAEAQVQAKMDYVAASRIIGLRPLAILILEVLPNAIPLIVTLLTVEMGICAVVESVLSFVGESIASDYPTWGSMIASGRAVIHQGWWLLLFPSLALIVTVLSFNLLGDGLRRTVDPVHR